MKNPVVFRIYFTFSTLLDDIETGKKTAIIKIRIIWFLQLVRRHKQESKCKDIYKLCLVEACL